MRRGPSCSTAEDVPFDTCSYMHRVTLAYAKQPHGKHLACPVKPKCSFTWQSHCLSRARRYPTSSVWSWTTNGQQKESTGGLADRAHHRDELAANPNLRVDVEYYLANQVTHSSPQLSLQCLPRLALQRSRLKHNMTIMRQSDRTGSFAGGGGY